MKFKERFQKAINDSGMSQSELSRRTGISKSSINEWLKGKYEPKQDKIYLLSKALEVDPAWLMGVSNLFDVNEHIMVIYNQLEPPRQEKVYNYANNQLIEQNQVQEATTVYVTSKLSAGPGVIDLDPRNVEEVQYDGYVPRHDLAFQVAGDSMEPLFEDGEIVFVERTEDIYSGQVIAVQINEESFIKKAYIENEQLRLVSLNSMYDDILADGTDNIRVVGRVIL